MTAFDSLTALEADSTGKSKHGFSVIDLVRDSALFPWTLTSTKPTVKPANRASSFTADV
jgi:hypothetical protein